MNLLKSLVAITVLLTMVGCVSHSNSLVRMSKEGGFLDQGIKAMKQSDFKDPIKESWVSYAKSLKLKAKRVKEFNEGE